MSSGPCAPPVSIVVSLQLIIVFCEYLEDNVAATYRDRLQLGKIEAGTLWALIFTYRNLVYTCVLEILKDAMHYVLAT